MKKHLPLFVVLLIFAAVLGLSFLRQSFLQQPAFQDAVEQSQQQADQADEASQIVTQSVFFEQNTEPVIYQTEVSPKSSVLQLLLQVDELEVTVEEYSFGSLVTAINGIENGTNDNYWIFYVNGEESTVGASEYQVSPGDSIEWRFESYEE